MNEQSYIKFGTLTTHSYEVTFGPGTLGINLQATRAGFGNNFLTRLKYDNFTQKKKNPGGYVDTFYRPADGSILAAEQNGVIKRG